MVPLNGMKGHQWVNPKSARHKHAPTHQQSMLPPATLHDDDEEGQRSKDEKHAKVEVEFLRAWFAKAKYTHAFIAFFSAAQLGILYWFATRDNVNDQTITCMIKGDLIMNKEYNLMWVMTAALALLFIRSLYAVLFTRDYANSVVGMSYVKWVFQSMQVAVILFSVSTILGGEELRTLMVLFFSSIISYICAHYIDWECALHRSFVAAGEISFSAAWQDELGKHTGVQLDDLVKVNVKNRLNTEWLATVHKVEKKEHQWIAGIKWVWWGMFILIVTTVAVSYTCLVYASNDSDNDHIYMDANHIILFVIFLVFYFLLHLVTMSEASETNIRDKRHKSLIRASMQFVFWSLVSWSIYWIVTSH